MFGKKKKLDANKRTGLLNEPKCAKCKAPIYVSWKDESSMNKLGVNKTNLGGPLAFPPKEGTHTWIHMHDPMNETSTHDATPHDGRTMAQQNDSDMSVSAQMLGYEQRKTDRAFNDILKNNNLSDKQWPNS